MAAYLVGGRHLGWITPRRAGHDRARLAITGLGLGRPTARPSSCHGGFPLAVVAVALVVESVAASALVVLVRVKSSALLSLPSR